MDTYKTLQQNENRALSLSLYENNEEFIELGRCEYSVYDSNDNVVIPEQVAYVKDNKAYMVVGPTVTSNVGEYYVVWKITDADDYIYYNKTYIKVV